MIQISSFCPLAELWHAVRLRKSHNDLISYDAAPIGIQHGGVMLCNALWTSVRDLAQLPNL